MSTRDRIHYSVDASGLNPQACSLNERLADIVSDTIDDWTAGDRVGRLWARDSTLWTGSDEGNWLGWLKVTQEPDQSQKLSELSKEIQKEGFSQVLLLGMGGSSLFPEVLTKTFGKIQGYPELHVLDSTDPGQIKHYEAKLDLSRTLFIVSSKSGSTLEPNILKQYFFEQVKQLAGACEAGRRFIAITDPGSKMQEIAQSDGFRATYYGEPTIGGRYSALSNFGRVPAALMGLNVANFINRAEGMVNACTSRVPVNRNPGVVLGVIIGVLARTGRDKVTVITSPEISGIGAWLEQLLAESTGKNGKGLIPVDGEQVGPAQVYGDDRLFIYLRFDSTSDREQDQAVRNLERNGQPVVRISMADLYNLGQEVFRWEMATAVAGAILEINPFDQPDVEASKTATRDLTHRYEKDGSFPTETAFYSEGGVSLFADEENRSVLCKAAEPHSTLVSILKAHLERLTAGDYFAILAYIEMNPIHQASLQRLRHLVRDRFRVATCLGFGPRFLHSTGQAYKGGPNSGVFLQITCDDLLNLPVPGQKYTFGVVKSAQARGDFQVLAERHRRALRVHLCSEAETGLLQLNKAVAQALGSR